MDHFTLYEKKQKSKVIIASVQDKDLTNVIEKIASL